MVSELLSAVEGGERVEAVAVGDGEAEGGAGDAAGGPPVGVVAVDDDDEPDWRSTLCVTVHGVTVPDSAPVKDVWACMTHPDGFLYLVLVPLRP